MEPASKVLGLALSGPSDKLDDERLNFKAHEYFVFRGDCGISTFVSRARVQLININIRLDLI